jgi:hypothetical protein
MCNRKKGDIMEPLDLTKRPPRSPREKLGGLYFLARTIDKMRASLPGGNIGAYKIAGSSMRLLDAIGVKAEELQEVVARSASEEEAVAWVRSHSDQAAYEKYNRAAETRSLKDLDAERLAAFAQSYPNYANVPSGLLFDILEDDDARAFEKINR